MTVDPLVMSIPVRRKTFPAIKLLAYPRGVSLSRIYQILWHKLWPLHSSALHWLLQPSSDFLMSSRVSNSAEFKSFLLIVCIDAPESTTNSLSSGLRVDGAGRHQFSEGEKNAVFCFSFNISIFLASLHGASRAHRSCHSVSSWDRSSNFGALGLRWWGSPGQIYPNEGFWSRMLAWRNTALVKLNTSDWLYYVWALPQNRWRLRRLHILKYATQLSCILQYSHWTFVTILFIPFARLSINLAVCIRALFPKPASIFGLAEQALRRMPFFTKWVIASSFEVILARPSRHSTARTLTSGTSGSSMVFAHSAK